MRYHPVRCRPLSTRPLARLPASGQARLPLTRQEG